MKSCVTRSCGSFIFALLVVKIVSSSGEDERSTAPNKNVKIAEDVSSIRQISPNNVGALFFVD